MSNLTNSDPKNSSQEQPGCSPIVLVSLLTGSAALGIIMQAVALRFSILITFTIALLWGIVSFSLLATIYGPEVIREPASKFYRGLRLSDRILTMLLAPIFATSVLTAAVAVGALYELSELDRAITAQQFTGPLATSPIQVTAPHVTTMSTPSPTPAASQPISTTTPVALPTRRPRMLLPWTSGSPSFLTVSPSAPEPTPSANTMQPPMFSKVTIADVNQPSGFTGTALSEEYIVLLNFGKPIDLAGWTLTVSDGRRYIFANTLLETNGIVKIHTGTGTNTQNDLYWGQTASIFKNGGIIVLKDRSGAIVDQFQR